MLYGEECVSSLIKCQLCQCKLTEAKIIPCGLFCNNCMGQLIKDLNKGSNEFNCDACNETHSIPKNGFKCWKGLNEFYSRELNLEEIYRGESAEKLKQHLDTIQKKIDEFDFKLTNGIDTVKEHCLKLKNEISLEAEVAIKRIQDVRDGLIGEIDSYEVNCVSNLEWDKSNKKRFNRFLKELRNFHQYWTDYLKKYQINDAEMADANNLSLEFETKLEQENKKFEVFIFNNKSISLKKNVIKIGKNYLGNWDSRAISDDDTNERKLCLSGICVNPRFDAINYLFCMDHRCNFGRSQLNSLTCKSQRIQGTEFCDKHVCVGCLMSNTKPANPGDPIACDEHQCNEGNCKELIISTFHRFCIQHVCLECATSGDIRNLPRKLGSLCEYHKCSVPFCTLKRFSKFVQFCTKHLCRPCAENDKILNGVDLACPPSQLCKNHRCTYSNSCIKVKLNRLSQSCVDHSCEKCISSKTPLINQIENMKRKTCFIHKLCNFTNKNGKLCNELARISYLYCNVHQSIPRKCSGYNSKNKPCGSKQVDFKVGNEWYCDAHRPIDASIEMSDSSDEDDKVVYSRVSHRFLNPVVSAQKEVNQFKQIKCNHGNCAILTFCHIDISVWICPIHENLQ